MRGIVLAVAGALAVPLAAGLLATFGIVTALAPTDTIRRLPWALQEMVPAVWLKVKGFNPSAIAFGEAKTVQAKFG